MVLLAACFSLVDIVQRVKTRILYISGKETNQFTPNSNDAYIPILKIIIAEHVGICKKKYIENSLFYIHLTCKIQGEQE